MYIILLIFKKKKEAFKMNLEKPFTAMAHIHSLKGELQAAHIIRKIGDNDYIAEYNGVRCHAIYNPFVGRFYVDDVNAVIETKKEDC